MDDAVCRDMVGATGLMGVVAFGSSLPWREAVGCKWCAVSFLSLVFFRQLIRSPAACRSMLCVMHAQMPCHIKWRVKLELAGKKNTKYTEILQKKRWVKPKQKAAPNQSQQYFSGLFQLACRWLHTKSEIARLTLGAIASKREREIERAGSGSGDIQKISATFQNFC